jgi:hypothetical protein
MTRQLKWKRSQEGHTETHCGEFEIYPEYEGTTSPQSWRLWQNKNGRRIDRGSHFTQRGAKDEAYRLAQTQSPNLSQGDTP